MSTVEETSSKKSLDPSPTESRFSDFDFEFPEELIAQSPTDKREDSRLLLVRRCPEKGLPRFEDLQVRDLPSLIQSETSLREALWVRNHSHVFQARFYAQRPTGSVHEIVLVENTGDKRWKALIRNSKKMKFPQKLCFQSNTEECFEALNSETLDFSKLKTPLKTLLQNHGEMPLPPYITQRDSQRDNNRYQSLWANPDQSYSVAAPTASLHFGRELLGELEKIPWKSTEIYLHVGPGTFESPRVEELVKHHMHSEKFLIPHESFKLIEEFKDKKIVALGSTALRCLESLHPKLQTSSQVTLRRSPEGDLQGRTRIFIQPGFEFSYTKALFTNFHLPQSTLMVLLSTFAGSTSLAKEAYKHAIQKKYRFFSYGDASLWL